MRRVLYLVLVGLLSVMSPAWAATRLLDEGVSQGFINELDVTGEATASRSGIRGTINVPAGAGGGDVTSVGDVTTGAAFDGTQGTILTFNNAGGDKTLDYDGTDFLFTAPLSVDAADPADSGAVRLDNNEAIGWEASPAGTDVTLTVDASEILQASGAFNAAGAITGSNLSGTNTGDNTVATTGDTATAFFSLGTLEHERGGLEADVSAYDGLIGITGGATYNQTGTTTQIIIFDGAGAPTSAALSGDVTMTNGGVVTIAADAVALGTDTTGGYAGSSTEGGVATSATILATARTIGGTSFDGSANIAIGALNSTNVGATTSLELLGVLSNETGSGLAVFGTSPTITTSLAQDGDVADAGYLRLANAALIGWEASPAGTDVTLTVDSSEILQASGAFTSAGTITGVAGTFSGLVTANANATIGNGATTAGVLTLLEDTDAGSNFASFQVPALAGNTVYTLPTDDGDANQVLSTDGSGVLDWVTGGAGTVTSVGWTGGLVSVATATTTPAFTVAGTSGGIPYFSGATTWASSGALGAGDIVIGGGAGATPTSLSAGATTTVLVGGGASTTPIWTTATGSGAPVRAGSPTLTGTALTSALTASGLVTANANVTIGNGATTAGVLTLLEDTDAGSNFASFQVPALAANTVYTLPADDGTASQFLQTDGAGVLSWATASGTDTNAVREYWYPASALEPLEAADSIPPLSKWTGTNSDILTVSFDASTDEGRKVSFKVPSDVQSGSTITFRVVWFARTATTNNVIWDFRYTTTGAEGESWDGALTTLAAAADAVQGTTNLMTVTTVTETLANLGWAANDVITVMLYRDANNASDTMADDAQVVGMGVEIPRA